VRLASVASHLRHELSPEGWRCGQALPSAWTLADNNHDAVPCFPFPTNAFEVVVGGGAEQIDAALLDKSISIRRLSIRGMTEATRIMRSITGSTRTSFVR
jgi:hypothetical protein